MEMAFMPGTVYDSKYMMFKEFLAAGFSYAFLDLMQYCGEDVLENREKIYENYHEKWAEGTIFLPREPERMLELLDFFIQECKKKGVHISIARAPALLANTERRDSDALLYRLALESIKTCRAADCNYLLVYPLIRQPKDSEEEKKNRAFFLSLAQEARENDVTLLLKNFYSVFNGHNVRGCYSGAYALRELADTLNREAGTECFGICLDTGVCNLLGQSMPEFMEILGRQMKAVLLSENDGIYDSALMPFTALRGRQSVMDWRGIVFGLRGSGFDGPVICDFEDSRGAVSHLLRADLMRYEKKIADYLEWQFSIERTLGKYDTRVVFGAGNMCRNYMKCYGKTYPPLYTCDNNPALWGTEFEGLTVKNPKELLELDASCAIFICNIYYDAIEKQLRGMGLTNPIERFSDEFIRMCP